MENALRLNAMRQSKRQRDYGATSEQHCAEGMSFEADFQDIEANNANSDKFLSNSRATES